MANLPGLTDIFGNPISTIQQGPQAPGGFQGFLADPSNVASIAPYVSDRHAIKTNTPQSFWDSKSNFLDPSRSGFTPDQQAAKAKADAATQPQILPPSQSGQSFNAQPAQQPASWFNPSQQQPQQAQPAPTAQQPAQSNVASWFQPSKQTQQDQAQLRNLQDSGAGLNKIQNKPLRVLSSIADVAGTIIAPGVAAQLPGTTLHNRVLQNQQQGRIQNDIANDQANAQRVQQGLQAADTISQTSLRNAQAAQQPELTAIKQATLDQHYAQIGFRPQLDANGNPTGQYEPDTNSPVYQKQQAQNAYFQARKDVSDAMAELDRAKNNPKSPAYKQAQQKLAVSAQNANTAAGRLGLSRDNYNLKAYGIDSTGNPAAGALQDENGNTVGTAFQANVKPTNTQRDAAGRAETQEDLRKRLVTQLRDPEIQAGLGPLAGRVSEGKEKVGVLSPKMAQFYNDIKSYGAFQAGMHPVRGVGALEYFDKIMGGLGQDAGQLAGKLQSNEATAQSVQKVGNPRLAKGGALNAPASGANSRTYKQTAIGPNGLRIGSNDGGKTWLDVKTGKEYK